MPRRVLVAGIGNIFLGDDGFGVEVVRRLSRKPLADGVDVVDFGIRGLHLAYELASEKYDAAVLVDAAPRGDAPGTLYVIQPDLDAAPADVGNGHSVTPSMVLGWIRMTGGRCGRVLLVGCEPATVDEAMELSGVVAASVEPAVDLVRTLASELARGVAVASGFSRTST